MRVALNADAPFGGWERGLRSHHLSPVHNSSLTTALPTACLAFGLCPAACTVPTNAYFFKDQPDIPVAVSLIPQLLSLAREALCHRLSGVSSAPFLKWVSVTSAVVGLKQR